MIFFAGIVVLLYQIFSIREKYASIGLMSDQSPFQGQPTYVEKTSHKKRLVTIFFIVLILIIAALGALYLLGSPTKHPITQPTTPIPTETMSATPTPATSSATLTSTPSATVTPSLTLTSLRISVLNGSGIPGAADKLASALKDAGYTTVTTGNASSFTYTGITVYVKDKANLAAVKKEITALDPSVNVTASVDPTIASDIEIIVGK